MEGGMDWETGAWVLLSLLCKLRLVILGNSQSPLTQASGLIFNDDLSSILYIFN